MRHQEPPKLPLKLFRWFCNEDRLEELEGDLYEVYNELVYLRGSRWANLLYWWLVIRSFRSFALKSTKRTQTLKIMTHIKHNFTIAWRNLRKHKTTTAINLLGLSIGIATFLGIITIVRYELSFNEEIPNKDRVYRIYTAFSGAFNGTNSGVATPIGPYVEEHFKSLDAIAYFKTWSAKVKFQNGEDMKEIGKERRIILATPGYFDVINQYQWLAGNQQSLNQPHTVVLTDEQAYKYFGTQNWSDILNKELIYSDSLRVDITGIVKQDETNSNFNFTDFISHATIEATWLKDRFNHGWTSTSNASQVFVLLNHQEDIAQLNNFLTEVDKHAKSFDEDDDGSWITNYKTQPLTEMHFDTAIGTFNSETSPTHFKVLMILMVVGFIILLIAIFNFINLETAQSTLKSKEVGVRKVLGSAKSLLVGRFLTESGIITILSTLLSLPIAHFGLKYFADFLPSKLTIDYSNPIFWLSLLLIIACVAILAGFYPSWVLASFKPINALKSSSPNHKLGGAFVRKSLILLQFLFSQLLIFGTLIISWQISYMLDKELGFTNEGIINIQTPYYEDKSKQKILLNKMEEIPQVEEHIVQGQLPAETGMMTTTIKFKTDSTSSAQSVHMKYIEQGYFEFYDLEFVAGNHLIPNDTLNHYIVNESFIKEMGIKDPAEAIGQSFDFDNGPNNDFIIGVIKDYHFQSLHHHIEPMMFNYEEDGKTISFKATKENIQPIIDELTPIWNELYPDEPLEATFMDEMIGRFYHTERQTSKLTSIATIVAILISCLGLFGLVSFTIVRKTKEIGIRKVLGANVFQLSMLLTREFLMLVAIAFLISLPITYFFSRKFEESFAYNAPIGWWLYLFGGLVSVIIAFISIGLKIVKASRSNPVDSLRYE